MKFNIMDRTGHTTEVFDKASKVSTEDAMKRFEELTKQKGYHAAKALPGGQHEKIHAFDPAAEEVLFFPHLVGG